MKISDALKKLAAEVGALAAFEREVREIVGNTNWSVLMQRRQEAIEALSAEASAPESGAEPIAWHCAKCLCQTYARIHQLSDNGKVAFKPGDYVRCVNCKDISFFPEALAAAPEAPRAALQAEPVAWRWKVSAAEAHNCEWIYTQRADTADAVMRDGLPCEPLYLTPSPLPAGAEAGRLDQLERALRGLVMRLDFVHASSAYRSVWALAQLHSSPYDGPTYTAALDDARRALSTTKGGD